MHDTDEPCNPIVAQAFGSPHELDSFKSERRLLVLLCRGGRGLFVGFVGFLRRPSCIRREIAREC